MQGDTTNVCLAAHGLLCRDERLAKAFSLLFFEKEDLASLLT
jgi:hypothetical protein